jgi:hypothetical protein
MLSILVNWSYQLSRHGKPMTACPRAYRTVVPLDIPAGLDVSLSLVLNSPAGSKLQAQLFVGGYQYGRFVPWVGNQVVFPVPPGILDYHGNNNYCLGRVGSKRGRRKGRYQLEG